MKRDGANKSLWQDTDQYKIKNKADLTKQYDVAIIGGGITGLTTALLLQHAGKKCIILEAQTIGFGTTGGTTAHLNTFFDTPYSKVIKNFGLENAKLLARGAKAAIALIKQNIATYNIDCDFKELNALLFSVNESQDKELDDIVETAKQLDVSAGYTNNTLFPIPYIKLASFDNQAQFNPIKYIIALAAAFENLGGIIAQKHRVIAIKTDKEILEIETDNGSVHANNAIYATHIPPGVNLLHFRCAPYRSYALAVKLKDENYPDALGYDMNDPYHYYRSQNINNELYLIAGGEDHKTGHEDNATACLRRLESHVRSYFNVKEVTYKWSSQYYESVDGLPYIGNLPASDSRIFVATGFGGNGMIYGTLSAILLSNILINGESIYQNLFDPNRIKPVAGFTNFVKEGADVVAHLIKDKLTASKINELADIASGESKVIKHNGHTLAIYKDENHMLHSLNATCTHLKCIVSWNNTEKSWDCPCHGARFSITGEVLNGPAQIDLKEIEWNEE